MRSAGRDRPPGGPTLSGASPTGGSRVLQWICHGLGIACRAHGPPFGGKVGGPGGPALPGRDRLQAFSGFLRAVTAREGGLCETMVFQDFT